MLQPGDAFPCKMTCTVHRPSLWRRGRSLATSAVHLSVNRSFSYFDAIPDGKPFHTFPEIAPSDKTRHQDDIDMELGLYTFADVSPQPGPGAIGPHERLRN